MKGWTKETLRWIGILVPGGFGMWWVFWACCFLLFGLRNDPLFIYGMALVALAILAAPSLAVAYLCLRRRYRDLLEVLGILGAIATLFFLVHLASGLNRSGHIDHFERLFKSNNLGILLIALVDVARWIGPFVAAYCVWRYLHRWAQRTPQPGFPQVRSQVHLGNETLPRNARGEIHRKDAEVAEQRGDECEPRAILVGRS
jgi:hypothetical protein